MANESKHFPTSQVTASQGVEIMTDKPPHSTREKLENSYVNVSGFREPLMMLVGTFLAGGLANYVFPDTSWALPVGMLVGFAAAFFLINEDRNERRSAATKMSDEELISFCQERERDQRQMTTFVMMMACVVTLLVGLFAWGLLFTEQGQEILRAVAEAGR